MFVKDFVSCISLSVCHSCIGRPDTCGLNLSPATLCLSAAGVSGRNFLGPLKYIIIMQMRMLRLLPFLFVSFWFPTAASLLQLGLQVLNWAGFKSGQPCLVPGFSSNSLMLAVEVCLLYPLSFQDFYYEKVLDCVKGCFCISWNDVAVLVFWSIYKMD